MVVGGMKNDPSIVILMAIWQRYVFIDGQALAPDIIRRI
jgi:hypothetical protein